MPLYLRKVKIKIILLILFSVTLIISLSKNVHAGTTPPITTYTQSPSSPDGNNGWYITPVQFDLVSTDLESGVKEINYRIDGGTWQKLSFSDTLNLAQNPSFELTGPTTSSLDSWEATTVDGQTTYSQDTTNWDPNYSAKIETTATGWHGINNKDTFAVAYAYENMTASLKMKTQDVTGSAYFKVYAISENEFGDEIVSQLTQSSALTGTNGWTNLSVNFTAQPESVLGIYIDIGLDGPGIVWADAVVINSSTNVAQTTVTVADDGEDHSFEFYAVDTAGNTETYSCTDPKKNCIEFNLDTTPPGNWNNSGAFRGFFGSDHELYVYTNVEDETSGLSTFTDKYNYHTDREDGFGRFEDLLGCNTNWLLDTWTILISPPFFPGVNSAYLLTPKTDFCDNNWKICKTVRFYAEDMAGNSVTKDFCINGPWIQILGEGTVRANQNIDMIAEPENDNTDGLIEVGGNIIDFFTSSKGWRVKNSTAPELYDYSRIWNKITNTKTEITTDLVSSDGVYYRNGDFEISSQTVPNDYDDATFDQIVFIDGDLTISSSIEIDPTSTALFVVSGNVNIEKNITTVGVAIFTDGTFNTAYDAEEGDSTQNLEMIGLFHAQKFEFRRTLQGTNNSEDPSETFVYEPKYLVNLVNLFENYSVQWKNIE